MTSDTQSGDPLGDLLRSAAAEVFAEHGYDGAKVAEIARRAGVTTGAIYSRYRGKADLMADALSTHMNLQVENAVPDAPEGGAALLSRLGERLLDTPDGMSNWLGAEALVASRRDPELAAMLRRAYEDDHQRLLKIVQQAKDDGQLDRELDSEAVAFLINAIGMGMNTRRLLELDQPDADSWTEVIGRLLLAGHPQLGAYVTSHEPEAVSQTDPISQPGTSEDLQ